MVSIVVDLGAGFAVCYWFSAHSVLPGVLLRFPHFVIRNSSLRLWVLPIGAMARGILDWTVRKQQETVGLGVASHVVKAKT